MTEKSKKELAKEYAEFMYLHEHLRRDAVRDFLSGYNHCETKLKEAEARADGLESALKEYSKQHTNIVAIKAINKFGRKGILK